MRPPQPMSPKRSFRPAAGGVIEKDGNAASAHPPTKNERRVVFMVCYYTITCASPA